MIHATEEENINKLHDTNINLETDTCNFGRCNFKEEAKKLAA